MNSRRMMIGKRKTAIIAFFVCFMVLIGVYMSLRITSLLHNHIEKQIARHADVISNMIQLKMETEFEELEDVSTFLSDERYQMETVLQSKQEFGENGYSYGVLDIDGNAVVGETLSMTTFPSIRNAFRGKNAASYDAEQGLLFAIPIFRGYNIRYVLYKRYDIDYLAQHFQIDCYDGMGHALVCDEDGQIIITMKEQDLFFEKMPIGMLENLKENLNIHSSSCIYSRQKGDNYFYFISEIQNTKFIVLGFVPLSAVSDGISYIISLVIWIYGLLLFLFVFGSIYLVGMEEKARESDELREAKEVAEKASNTRGIFLANMSHEIRTPINAVMSLNEMILRETQETDTKEYALKIQNASQSLLGIVNDVLDFSKIDSGKMELVPVAYQVTQLVDALSNMIRIRAEAKNLELKLTIAENLPSILYGDDVRIRQIIINLLTNAVKYTDQGTVELKISGTIQENQDTSVLKMHVEVQDTGRGIREEDIHNLFNMFGRIDMTQNRTIEGTGLGLTITNNLLNLMGSELKVQSQYMVGSCFYFDLEQEIVDAKPIGNIMEKMSNEANSYEYQVSFTAENAKVLAVDDVDINLFVFKGLLKNTKVSIDTALSGAEALQMMEETKYDLVFIDHMMPGMDGIEVLKHMRESTGVNAGTPAIAFTANALSGAQEYYLTEGFSDFLEKPVSGRKLEVMLQSYLPKDKVVIQNAEKDEKVIETPSETDELLNEEYGIKYSGTKDVFLKVVHTFVESADKTIKEIDSLYQSVDFDTYIIKVHGLKSSARIIGAMKLSKAAEHLEFSGKAGDFEELHKKHEPLLSLYKETVAELCRKYQLKKEDELFSGNQIPYDELMANLEMISQCNESFDYDTVDKIMEKLVQYEMPEFMRDDMKQLKDAVYDIDQTTIGEIVTICMKKLKTTL